MIAFVQRKFADVVIGDCGGLNKFAYCAVDGRYVLDASHPEFAVELQRMYLEGCLR